MGVQIPFSFLKSLDFKPLQTKVRVLPWQMNSIRIIKISYHKMPYNAEICKVLSAFSSIVFFLFITTLFVKYFKMVQLGAMCSSQIVVR